MTKRAATYDIDPLTFEEKEREKEEEAEADPNAPHMKGRKIYKLTRSQQTTRSNPESRPTLIVPRLFEKQASDDKKEQQQPSKHDDSAKISLFGGTSAAPNLFANLFSNTFYKSNTGQKPEAGANINPGTKDNNEKPPSIFGSLFGKGTSGTSIFGPGPSIFVSSTSNTIFGNSGSVFATTNKPQTQDSSLANFAKSQPVQDGQEEADSAELEKGQAMEVDPSKSQLKFDYGDQGKVIKKVKLVKYKMDKGHLIDNPLIASLVFDSQKKSYYLLFQLAATYKTIFTGLLIPGKSQVKILNKKSENIQMLLFNLEKEKLKSHVIKIQIIKDINDTESNDKEFFETVQQVIEGRFQSKTD